MKSFLSIKGRLLIFSLSISLIPITIITTIYYLNVRRYLKYQILEKLRAVAESREQHILTYMKEIAARTKDFSSDGFIKNSLERIVRGGTSVQDVGIRLNKYLLKNKLPLYDCLIAIAIVDGHGKVVSSTCEKLIDEDFSDRDIFKQVISKNLGETYIGQPHYSSSLNTNCIFVSAPIISKHGAESLGVIINAYILNSLNEITTNRVGMGETGEVYLVNRGKIMLTESRFIDNAPFKKIVDTAPVRKIVEDGKEMVGIYKDYRGMPVVGAAMNISEYGWMLLAEIDKAEAFAPLKILGTVALVLGIVGATVVTGFGVIFAISTSKPIKELKNATERFADGALDYRVEVARMDEIGDLAKSFNVMAANLEREITEHKRADEVLKESEQRFRNIFDNAKDGILLADTETKKFYTGNKSICQMLGYSLCEIKNLGVVDIHPREDLSHVIEQFEKQTKKEIILAKDIPVKRKNCSVFYADINASLMFLDGKTYLMGTFRDVTDRKRAEEALKKSEASLANAQRIAKLGNWEWDIVKNELRWSD